LDWRRARARNAMAAKRWDRAETVERERSPRPWESGERDGLSPERGGPATCTRGFESGERMPLGPGSRAPIAVGSRFCGGGRGSWTLYSAAV
jgi:hypothetical protein